MAVGVQRNMVVVQYALNALNQSSFQLKSLERERSKPISSFEKIVNCDLTEAFLIQSCGHKNWQENLPFPRHCCCINNSRAACFGMFSCLHDTHL